jgi:predicted outer membrane repeat protein
LDVIRTLFGSTLKRETNVAVRIFYWKAFRTVLAKDFSSSRGYNRRHNMFRVFVLFCFVGVALAGEWDCVVTSGVFTLSSDCPVSSQVVVTGALNVTGIPDAQGNLPKIIGGGSNRLFKVESGGQLVVRSLNLTGGVTSNVHGAAAHISGTSSNFKATYCTFYGNSATGTGRGGAIFGQESDIIIEDSSFYNNHAAVYGGAIVGQSKVNIHIASSIFKGNEASKYGGAIWIDDNGSQIMLSKSHLFDNVAGENGGVLSLHATVKATVSNSVMKGNRANGKGGAIFCTNNAELTVVASTFGGNMAAAVLNAIHVDDNSWIKTVRLVNFDKYAIVNGTENYNSPTCETESTICADNGYPNAICTTRQNPDEGVICATNCTPGTHKAGTFNHTCVACHAGQFSNSLNQYQCAAWTNCPAGKYTSFPGNSSRNRNCSVCPSGQYTVAENLPVCSSCNVPPEGNVTVTEDCIQRTQIVVTGNLNVTGNESVYTTIQGGGNNRHFYIGSGAPTLTLRWLNLTGGHWASEGAQQGGGSIFSYTGSLPAPRLRISNCVFYKNTVSFHTLLPMARITVVPYLEQMAQRSILRILR